MHAIKIYLIISVMAMIIGAQHTQRQKCSVYCKKRLHGVDGTRRDCDCFPYQGNTEDTKQSKVPLPNIRIKDTGIYYEPIKNQSKTVTSIKKLVHLRNPISNRTKIRRNTLQSRKDQMMNSVKLSTKKSGDKTYSTNVMPLYLDIDILSRNVNKTWLKETLVNVFDNVQPIEQDLLDCINLHIIVFSKNSDKVNKTNKNWGHNGAQFDSLSNSEIFAQIQSKCNQPTSIMKLGLEDIINRSIKKKYIHTGLTKYFVETTESLTYDNNVVRPSKQVETKNRNKQGKLSYEILLERTEALDYTTIETNKYEQYFDTYNETDSTDSKNQIDTNTVPIHTFSGNEPIKIFQNLNNEQPVKISIRNTSAKSDSGLDSWTTTDEFLETNFYTDPDKKHSVTISPEADPRNINLPLNTSTTIRVKYYEGDIHIPKISTREFRNNTVIGSVDGYEMIPNTDYIDPIPKNIDNEFNSDLSTSVTLTKGSNTERDLETVDQASIGKMGAPEIKGNLYFLYGKHEIPAHFIQSRDGKIRLAIDGHSLCDTLNKKNEGKSVIMRLLCKCMKMQNCADTM